MWLKKKNRNQTTCFFFLFSILFQMELINLPVQLHISQAVVAQIAVGVSQLDSHLSQQQMHVNFQLNCFIKQNNRSVLKPVIMQEKQ